MPPAWTAWTARFSTPSPRITALPVGVKTMAVMVGEEEDTVEDVYEPFLIQEGYILKTPRGRILAAKGYEHLGLKAPKIVSQGAEDEHTVLF